MLKLFLTLFLTGCTYSVSVIHTEGEATDLIDQTATNTPTTDVSVPVNLSPKPGL